MDWDSKAVQRLYQAVVSTAVEDAVKVPKWSTSVSRKKDECDTDYAKRKIDTIARRKTSAERQRDEARAWLLSGSNDFKFICTAAGYNPDDVRDRAARMALNGWIDGRKAA